MVNIMKHRVSAPRGKPPIPDQEAHGLSRLANRNTLAVVGRRRISFERVIGIVLGRNFGKLLMRPA
jgi:hypothetical protein